MTMSDTDRLAALDALRIEYPGIFYWEDPRWEGSLGNALAATPAPLMDIQKQSVVTTAPLDPDPQSFVPGYRVRFIELDNACAFLVSQGWAGGIAFDEAVKALAATPAPQYHVGIDLAADGTTDATAYLCPHGYVGLNHPPECPKCATPAPLDVEAGPPIFADPARMAMAAALWTAKIDCDYGEDVDRLVDTLEGMGLTITPRGGRPCAYCGSVGVPTWPGKEEPHD